MVDPFPHAVLILQQQPPTHPRRPRGSHSRRDVNRDRRKVFYANPDSRPVSSDCLWVSEDTTNFSAILILDSSLVVFLAPLL